MAVVIPLDADRARSELALETLKSLVADDLGNVNTVILERMGSDVPLIPELAGHLIASGGKRLRPMLTLGAAKLCGYTGGRHINLAACVEFIHTATLLHDDVVDESALRRGSETANALWGNEASVLVGDFLFSRAFQVMVADGSLAVLKILSDASAIIAEGEVAQIATRNDTTTGEDAYLDVITAKTAALFAAACRIGAVVAERPAAEEEALESYGRNLGIAFQLVDDGLDYASRDAAIGKTVGDDFREGKTTLPVILAFRRGGEEERKFWRRVIENTDQQDGDLEHAVQLMRACGALDDTVARARHYGAKAKDALGIFAASPEKAVLRDLVNFCINRAH
ncbi:MAG TPA: polyprenyl synthetase family protein [Alphaproteobacteria bacterium]|nr:polyprenyl synthetase family protein [Alphaproteobacteria bacterium]